jgi:hypothetical protein
MALPDGGTVTPASFSRSIRPSASAIGASPRSEISAKLPRNSRSSSISWMLPAMPGMRMTPSASQRACSSASNAALASGSAGALLRWVSGLWLAMRMAMASPWPRAMAMSLRVGNRGRLARRALSEVRIGRSAVKPTSRSALPETARTVAPTADLNAAVWSGRLALLRGG